MRRENSLLFISYGRFLTIISVKPVTDHLPAIPRLIGILFCHIARTADNRDKVDRFLSFMSAQPDKIVSRSIPDPTFKSGHDRPISEQNLGLEAILVRNAWVYCRLSVPLPRTAHWPGNAKIRNLEPTREMADAM